MQIQIESTDEIVELDGVLCRAWNGVTENGIPCAVFVHRLAVHKDADASQFDAELKAYAPPGTIKPPKPIGVGTPAWEQKDRDETEGGGP